MQYNREVLVGRGEIGYPVRTPLIQANGVAVNLTVNNDWTFELVVTDDTDAVVITGAMTPDDDQVTYPDYVTYEMTGTDVWKAEGEYKFQVHATDPDGNVLTFPKDKLQPYGSFVLLPTNITEPTP